MSQKNVVFWGDIFVLKSSESKKWFGNNVCAQTRGLILIKFFVVIFWTNLRTFFLNFVTTRDLGIVAVKKKEKEIPHNYGFISKSVQTYQILQRCSH